MPGQDSKLAEGLISITPSAFHVTGHKHRLANYLKLPEAILRLHTPLVTSAIVPFRFVQEPPIDPTDIIPIAKFKDYVSSLDQLEAFLPKFDTAKVNMR